MNLLLVADGHYYQTPDGTVYADSVFDYTFYKRYLTTFEHVYAVVRARQVDEVPKGKKLASGEGVSFLNMPVFQGPWQYAKNLGWLARVFWDFYDRNRQSRASIIGLGVFSGFCYVMVSRGYLAASFTSIILAIYVPFWIIQLCNKFVKK